LRYLSAVLLLLPFMLRAQLGGSAAFRYVLLPPTAKIAALGGTHVSGMGEDPGALAASPSLLNARMNRQISFNTAVYPGSANYGQLAYAHQFRFPGTLGWSVQYMTYGKIESRDLAGNVTGTFSPSEVNLAAAYAYPFARYFSVGAAARFFYSGLGTAGSTALTTDLGFTFHDTARLITATLVAKNLGAQLSYYGDAGREPMPMDLQAGLSVGFKKFPLSFHLTLHDLLRWDIRYDNPADQNQDALFIDSSQIKQRKYIADKIFSHTIFGVEANIKNVVRLMVSYNHQRQQELKLATRRGAPGLSFGIDVRIKQFGFGYSFQPLSQGFTLNHLSLRINTAGFVRRSKVSAAP